MNLIFKTILILIIIAPLLNSGCIIVDNEWDPNKYVEIKLNYDQPFYHFINGISARDAMPDDIEGMGIINEPWCTDLPALCGNYIITDKNNFTDFSSIPSGEFKAFCEEIPLNKVIVFKLENGNYALVKIISDNYNIVENEYCEHKITMHINYPALTGFDKEKTTAGSDLSDGEWELAAQTQGLLISSLASFNKLSSSVYMAGRVSSSQFAGHIGELRYQSSSYLKELNTPGYVNTVDLSCTGSTLLNILSSNGEFARCDVSNNTWGSLVQLDGINNPTSIFFVNEQIGYISSQKEIFRTSDGGANWQKVYNYNDGSKLFFTSNNTGFGLKSIGTDEGVVYKTSNGNDFTPYKFPLNWYGQPSATRLYGLYFLDENMGWICGEYGQIIATNNGGSSWQIIRHGGENEPHLFDIVFPSIYEGWACGSDGTLLKTIDGGKTWNLVDIGETDDLICLEFNSPYYGWVSTATKIYYYEDREKYWKFY